MKLSYLKLGVMVAILLRSTFSYTGYEENKALVFAVRGNHLEGVREAFEKGADPNALIDSDPTSRPIFYYAIDDAQAEIVLEFIKRKAYVNGPPGIRYIMTPLQLATTRFERDDSGEDSYQITKTLLEAGANPNQLISISMSRLNYNQSKQVYKLLLKEGSKPHFANCTWFNPWIWALEFKDDDFLATLHQFHPDCFSDGSHPFACLQGGWLQSIEFSWWFKLFNYRARCTSNPEQLRQGLELVLQNINLDRHWPTRVKQMIAVLVQEGVDVTRNNSDDQPYLSIVSREIKKWLIYHGQQGPHANLKAVLNSGRALGQIAGLLMQAGANADHLPDPLAVEFVSILQNKETPSSITPEQAKAFLRKSANLCFKLK